MTGRLEKKVAVITGAGAGIGLAVADRFVAEGAEVALLERDEQRAASLKSWFGPSAVVVPGDVSRGHDNERVVAAGVERFGRVDVVVANAGLYDFGLPLTDMDEAALIKGFDELFAVNVLSVLLLAKAAVHELRRTRGSMVVSVSCSGLMPGGGGPLYVASKHAAVGAVRQLALEFAPDVRVNGVAPGYTRTDLRGPRSLGLDERTLAGADRNEAAVAGRLPLRSVAEPEDHASIYVLLASAAESAHLTGVVIPSDGGMGVRP